MPATPEAIQQASAAFYPHPDNARILIHDDHPGAALARRAVDEVGHHYSYSLWASDWSYSAAAEILQDLTDDEYNPADPPYIDDEDDHAQQIADRLTDCYTADLIKWFSDNPDICADAESELDELGGIENATTILGQITACQNFAYYNAARLILYLLRDEEGDEDADEETESDGGYYASPEAICFKCTRVIYEHEQRHHGNICERCAQGGPYR